MKIVEVFRARGHPRITARHSTTLMITKEEEVGPKGDCIVAVGADKGAKDLSVALKRAIRAGRRVRVTLKVGDASEAIQGFGDPGLAQENPTDIVIRKSRFTCGRTVAIGADKAAGDLSRTFVSRLLDSDAEIQVSIEVL
jgi:hypothetical protein